MDDRKNYFDYVTDVLGIKSVMLEKTGTSEIPLLLKVESLSDYTAAETELLGKMIAALKMDMQMYRVVDLNQQPEVSTRFTVEFRDNTTASSDKSVQQVYSPRTLLKQPALKKQAWEDLQKVIRHFTA